MTLGLLSFLYLAARLTVYAAETNVVRARHLWPRSLLTASNATTDPTDWTETAETGRARDVGGRRPLVSPGWRACSARSPWCSVS